MPTSIIIVGFLFCAYFVFDFFTRYSGIVLLEFKNCFLLYAIFFVGLHIEFSKKNLKYILKNYIFTITTISILGIVEYLFPSIMSEIFNNKGNQNIIQVDLLFERVAFLFWGSHLAANLIPPIFPIIIYLRSEKTEVIQNKLILTSVIFINLYAIYLSGNRISWLIITIYLLLILFIYNDKIMPYVKTYSLIITISFVVYIYSQPVEGRYISTFLALTGKIDKRYDSSSAERLYRAEVALNSIKNKPMGTGWGSQGWVHSDILQIGASLGVITAFIFLMGQIHLLFNIYITLKKSSPQLQNGLFLCISLMLYTLISFLLNGNILKVQTGAPLFLAWIISYGFYMHIKSFEMKTKSYNA